MLTLAAVAAHKGIKPEKISVEIQRNSDITGPDWETSFGVRLDLGRGLTARERSILFGSARRCEVNKLLTGKLHFSYGWVDAPQATH